MRNQYSLGYRPGERRDGKQHKIVVKVDVDGDGHMTRKNSWFRTASSTTRRKSMISSRRARIEEGKRQS